MSPSDAVAFTQGLRVAIAGCTAAIELSRLECVVTVFERSPGRLEDRGAGIASSLQHLELLKARDLIDADMANVIPDPTRIFTVPGVADDGRGGHGQVVAGRHE